MSIESIGTYLKRERELRSITLEELAEATHIKIDYLEAIESDHFEKLPGFTFAKGYLRAYAQYTGLVPEEVLLHFQQYLQRLSGEELIDPQGSRKFWIITFLILVSIAVGVILFLQYQK